MLALGYFIFGSKSDSLEFRPRSSPEGFRELILDNRSQRQSSVLVSIRGSRSAEIADAPKGRRSNLCKALFEDAASPVLGDKNADVILVEFFDYRCPYCKTLSKTIHQIQKQYRLRVIYKEWPILGMSSQLAARAALAAGKQGKYLEFHTKLMQSSFIPTEAYIDDLAVQFDVNRSRLREDMNAVETALALRQTSALAAALNLVGTPSLVVGRTIVQGAISRSQLENLIEIETASKQASPC